MNKDYKVLSFSIDYENFTLKFLEKLEHFDKAPYGFISNEKNIDQYLNYFFRHRAIGPNRWDKDLILENTGCKNVQELSIKGHNLSLSDHYWFKKENEDLKYSDINFFNNKWDDSFARAVIHGDYKALKNCSLNVPDVVTQGWSVKGWLYEGGPKLYKLGIYKDHYEESIAEVLASKLALRLFSKDEVVEYKLKKIGDKYASVSSVIISDEEDMIPLSQILTGDIYDLYISIGGDKTKREEFLERIKDSGVPGLYQFFVKLFVFRTLSFISDLHFGNISLIKNNRTGEMRIAPLYDLAGSFGSTEHGRTILSNLDKASMFLIFFMYDNLNPNWDYSWYNPSKLEGFEVEIREMLSKSSFYTPELIDKIVAFYQYQKQNLDDLYKQNK